MNAKELIKKISEICQNTPELNINENPNAEAQRLDDVIWGIYKLCNNFLDDLEKWYSL